MLDNEQENKIQDIYKKAMVKLAELSLREKQIMLEYRKKRDARKIEELKNKIQNNG